MSNIKNMFHKSLVTGMYGNSSVENRYNDSKIENINGVYKSKKG